MIYAVILIGGFVKTMGRDHTPTLEHYRTGFAVDFSHGLFFEGAAWPSLFTTLKVAAISAPLTALIGLLTAYLLTRQRFAGRRLLEFATMLSFAIPGTVLGVAYILAFNVPPIEITGTGLILVLAFVFRNMPVGVRSGIAALAQIDKSLDEASTTLRARSFTTLRRVVLPLLKPALVAALIYSFVRTHHLGQRRDLSRLGRVQPLHRLHRRAGRGRRVRPRHRLFLGADRLHGGGHRAHPVRLVGERKLGRRPVALATLGRRARQIRDHAMPKAGPASVEFSTCQHALRHCDGGRRRQLHDPCRRARHAARPVRLRQDDDLAHDRRARDRQRRSRS